MNARREAKYRAAETEILDAKLRRLTRVSFLGFMSFTVVFSTFLYYGGLTKKSSALASDPKYVEYLQSGLTFGSNAMYDLLKTGKTLETEKNFSIPNKDIPLQ